MYDRSGTLLDRREELRVKFNSLMAEAKIIRREERRLKYGVRYEANSTGGKTRTRVRVPVPCPILLQELQDHRTKAVRGAARTTHLALGFIKGRGLREMEQYPRSLLTHAQWAAIEQMVKKYGNAEALERMRSQYKVLFNQVYATRPPYIKKVPEAA